jgi:hypothetical protein
MKSTDVGHFNPKSNGKKSCRQSDCMNVDVECNPAYVFPNRRKPLPLGRYVDRPLCLPWAATGGRPYIGSEGDSVSIAVNPSLAFSLSGCTEEVFARPHASSVGAHCVRPRAFEEVQGARSAPLRMGGGRFERPAARLHDPVTSLTRPLTGKGQRQTHRSAPTDTRCAVRSGCCSARRGGNAGQRPPRPVSTLH